MAFFYLWISGTCSVSLIIREEYGIQCMPCSSQISSKMTLQTCYYSNYRITNWYALYHDRISSRWRHLKSVWPWPHNCEITDLWHHLVLEHDGQCMSCSIKFLTKLYRKNSKIWDTSNNCYNSPKNRKVWCNIALTIAIILLKIEKFDVTLH